MLNLEQRQRLIAHIKSILINRDSNDADKATDVANLLSGIDQYEVIIIVQTGAKKGCEGCENSLLRTSIELGLPLVFEVIYNASGGLISLNRTNSYKFHSYREIADLMADQERFQNPAEPGVHPQNIFYRFNRNRITSWLQYMREEQKIEDDANIYTPSKVRMRNA